MRQGRGMLSHGWVFAGNSSYDPATVVVALLRHDYRIRFHEDLINHLLSESSRAIA